MNDDTSAPFITILTVARNMEGTVNDTVRSVLNAKTPSVEYIFVDGASTDATLEIVGQHRARIDHLISEPDKGQYDAINKGFSFARGEVMAWINADDVVMPWTFTLVEHIFRAFPEVSWITGQPSFLNAMGHLTKVYSKTPAYPAHAIANGWFDKTHGAYLQQESMFWRRSLWNKVCGIDLRYGLAGDFHLWTKFAKHAQLIPVDVPLAAFRERPGEQRSSRQADRYEAEVAEIRNALRRPGFFWRKAASSGLISRSLWRFLVTESAPVITYDRTTASWRIVTRNRSVSRVHFTNLIDERLMRKNTFIKLTAQQP